VTNPLRRYVPRFSRSASSPVALLTDFGLSDPYVGVMKAVVASINPHACIIDISHNVQSHNIRQGAFLLWSAYRYFPSQTVFVCVVDPGVGSDRRILYVRTSRFHFLAPDNGLLDFMLNEEKAIECMEVIVRNGEILGMKGATIPEVSSTFHGRDIFARVAGMLTLGRSWEKEARRIVIDPRGPMFVREKKSKIPPVILHIDSFGNIITNIRGASQDALRKIAPAVVIGSKKVTRWISHYAEAPLRTPCLIRGSSGVLEIVMKNASAAKALKTDHDAKIRIVAR
jgi:S-adenosyl-L-methionine hydrolase (adenosine-forming)